MERRGPTAGLLPTDSPRDARHQRLAPCVPGLRRGDPTAAYQLQEAPATPRVRRESAPSSP